MTHEFCAAERNMKSDTEKACAAGANYEVRNTIRAAACR